MSRSKVTTYSFGSSFDDEILKKQRKVDRYKKAVSKEFDSIFKTDEEKAIANIALEVSSRILFEFLKEESEYGR